MLKDTRLMCPMFVNVVKIDILVALETVMDPTSSTIDIQNFIWLLSRKKILKMINKRKL